MPWIATVAALLAQAVTVEDAMALAARGDFAGAQRALSAVVARQPRDADARYRLGVVQMRQQLLAEAAASLESAIRLDPRPAQFHLALAEARLRQQDRARAILAAAQAAERAKDELPLWRAIAALQARAGDGLGQARSLQQIVRLAPNDRAACSRLIELLLDHRTADGAAAIAAAATERFPRDAGLLRLRGLAEYALGRHPEAIRSFLAAVDEAPDDAKGYASLETLLPEAGEAMPEILARLRPFAARDPIGKFLLALALPGEAEAHLREAIAGASDFWPARYRLGLLLRDRGMAAEAIAQFEATLKLNPAHAESHYALAQLVADKTEARRHRERHHALRAEAVQAEQARAAAKPRLTVVLP